MYNKNNVKVLVTGGNGFVGRELVARLLERGYEVRSLARSDQGELKVLGVSVFRGSLTNEELVKESVKGCNAIFHVAAKAGVWGDDKEYFEINVQGTRTILQAARQAGVPHFIYTSTPSVVFNGSSFRGEDESLPYGSNWLCAYPKSKAIAEQDVLNANETDGMKTIAIRPHLIWGKGDPHIVPRILDRARSGKLRIVGDGQNYVNISHVKNVGHAHLLALDALMKGHEGGKSYFVSDEEPVNLWEWINHLLSLAGEKPLKKRVSLQSAYRIGAILEGIHRVFRLSGEPRMTRFVAVELGKDHYFSMKAAKRDLGYQPIISSEEGLDEMVKAGDLQKVS